MKFLVNEHTTVMVLVRCVGTHFDVNHTLVFPYRIVSTSSYYVIDDKYE